MPALRLLCKQMTGGRKKAQFVEMDRLPMQSKR